MALLRKSGKAQFREEGRRKRGDTLLNSLRVLNSGLGTPFSSCNSILELMRLGPLYMGLLDP